MHMFPTLPAIAPIPRTAFATFKLCCLLYTVLRALVSSVSFTSNLVCHHDFQELVNFAVIYVYYYCYLYMTC